MLRILEVLLYVVVLNSSCPVSSLLGTSRLLKDCVNSASFHYEVEGILEIIMRINSCVSLHQHWKNAAPFRAVVSRMPAASQ